MNLSLFDLHCDTAYEMYHKKAELSLNVLSVSLNKAEGFQKYAQVMAIWTDRRLGDEEGWNDALQIARYLQKDPAVLNGDARLVTALPSPHGAPALLLAIEDARILAGRIERVEQLFEMGVRILTPLWQGSTCIGGSHDTDLGLTDFGRRALRHAASLGIILDVSHASERSTEEILEISDAAGQPAISSHSNAYRVCPVSRNLRDRQIRALIDRKGLIGINLYTRFLSLGQTAAISDVLAHTDHLLSLGGVDALALGGDWDGCTTPSELPTIAALDRLANAMLSHGYSEALVHKIFYQNAADFSRRHFSTPKTVCNLL